MNYLITDIETIIDTERLIRTEANGLPTAAEYDATVQGILDVLCAKQETADQPCFVPARYHAPVVSVLLLVDDLMRYQNHLVIAGRDHKDVTARTWAAILAQLPSSTLVTFNGLKFDMPVLETCALDYGVSMGGWLKTASKPWEDPRHPTSFAHLDLFNFLSAKGSLGGSLNFWARNAGLPGKVSTSGASVAETIKKLDGLESLSDYCSCDVLNTYGLLYRILYTAGYLSSDYRGAIFEQTMEQMAVGRGTEVKAFMDLYRAQGLF